ncbi:MAG: hypothetical protein WBO44_02750 [Saprospiraceae bacterium]
MKYLTPVLFSILIVVSYWQLRNAGKLNTEVMDIRNSMDEYNKRKFSQWERGDYFAIIQNTLQEPEYPYTNELILEMHWITLIRGWQVQFIKLECMKDSSVNMTYKFATLKNLNDAKTGIDSLRKQTTQKLDKSIWLEFQEKLKEVNIYDLAYWNGSDDCFGISLSWKAAIGNNDYRYSTNCEHAEIFTEACELIMRQVDDPEIQEMLDYKEEVKERLNKIYNKNKSR